MLPNINISQDMINLSEKIYRQGRPDVDELITAYNGRTSADTPEQAKIRNAYKLRLALDLFEIVDAMSINDIQGENALAAEDLLDTALTESKSDMDNLSSSEENEACDKSDDCFDFCDLAAGRVDIENIVGVNLSARNLYKTDENRYVIVVTPTPFNKTCKHKFRIICNYKYMYDFFNYTINMVDRGITIYMDKFLPASIDMYKSYCKSYGNA